MVQFTRLSLLSRWVDRLFPAWDLLGTGDLSQVWLVTRLAVGIVAVVNAANFSDGADGLCGGLDFIGVFGHW